MASNTTMVALLVAFVTGAIALLFVSLLPGFLGNQLTNYLVLVCIPILAYFFSLGGSALVQYTSCNSIDTKGMFVTNLFVPLATGFATFVLFLESIPILKYIFGPYPPSDPSTGVPLEPSSEAFITAMESEKHYKLQFFSNIVKAVLPASLTESWKDGFASMYWIFFFTLLPTFFLFTLQSACPSGPK